MNIWCSYHEPCFGLKFSHTVYRGWWCNQNIQWKIWFLSWPNHPTTKHSKKAATFSIYYTHTQPQGSKLDCIVKFVKSNKLHTLPDTVLTTTKKETNKRRHVTKRVITKEKLYSCSCSPFLHLMKGSLYSKPGLERLTSWNLPYQVWTINHAGLHFPRVQHQRGSTVL